MQQKISKTFTYQTRLSIKENDEILTKTASLLSKVERELYKDYYHLTKSINDLKSEYIQKFKITARQFNSCRMRLDGKVRSHKELLREHISLLTDKIKKLKKHVQKLTDPFKSHQKKRRLSFLEKKLDRYKKDFEENRTRICFGGKRLFYKQFYLEENGYSSFEEWKEDWQKARNSSFLLVGSKDESAGNQTCQLIKNKDSFTLYLRLHNGFSKKTIVIENIRFSYGEKEILSCLEENEKRKELRIAKQEYSHLGKALTYLFKKDEKGWRVFVTIEQQAPEFKSKNGIGVIGIDINPNHLAVSETDRFGNIINKETLSYTTYGKDKNQALATISDTCKKIIRLAVKTKKPIVLENLDFSKKKSSLKEQSKKFSRMLSSFSYNKIIENIERKSFKEGIKIYKINPAYTSLIGKVKFSMRYGLSDHQAAALVIARRACNYSERPPRYLEIDNKNSKIAFPLPERNRGKHVWSFYSVLSKKLKAANVLHPSTRYRSSRPKNSCCDSESFDGLSGRFRYANR